MWIIVLLVIIAILLLVVELVLLPGISIAGLFSFISFVAAITYTYIMYGIIWGSAVLTISIILAIIAVVVSLKAGTWQRLSLKSTIDSTSNSLPQEVNIKKGDVGMALTRLAPMGKVVFGDITVEGRSVDVYIDQRSQVEVIDFDNNVVVVKPKLN